MSLVHTYRVLNPTARQQSANALAYSPQRPDLKFINSSTFNLLAC